MADEGLQDQRALMLDVLERHDPALVEAHRAWLAQIQRTAFDSGFQMAARVEQDHTRAELATFVLAVLGKERGDGAINLGTLGVWWPQDNQPATRADS